MTNNAENKNMETYYQSVLEMSSRQYNNGQLSDATNLVITALSTLPSTGDWIENHLSLEIQSGRILEMTAFLHNSSYDDAITIFKQVESKAKEFNSDLHLADALDEMANACLHQLEHQNFGNLSEIQNMLESALKIYEQKKHAIGICKTLILLGQADEMDQQYNRAIERFTRVSNIAQDHKYLCELSFAIRHLGKAHQRNNRPDLAYPLHKRSLEIRQEIGLKPFLPFSLVTMGQMDAERGETEIAVEHLLSAFDLSRELNAPFALMVCAQALTQFYNNLQNPGKQAEYYNIATKTALLINHQGGLTWSERNNINK